MAADTGMDLGEQMGRRKLLKRTSLTALGWLWVSMQILPSGMQQFVDLANAGDYQIEKMLANLQTIVPLI